MNSTMEPSDIILYGYDDNPRIRIVKIVAAATGVELKESLVVPRQGINKPAYMERFPLSQGKIPAIEGPGVKLTETIAIAHYLARSNGRSGLLGRSNIIAEEALVLSYASWANQELLQTLSRWFLPLIPGLTDPAPYNRDAVEAGKKSSLTLLAKLETILKDKVWLVGESPTLADIFVAVVISRGLQWVLGRTWRDGHPAIMAHFERTREWEPVHRTVTKFELIDEETKNIQPDKVV